MTKLDSKRLATLLRLPDGSQDLDRALNDLEDDPSRTSILNELLSSRDSAVRFWAIEAAERIYPRAEYIRALKVLVRDPDQAVSTDAIGRLVDIAPHELQPMARSMAKRLGTDIPSLDKVFILWTLAKMRASEANQEISKLRSKEPEWTKLARVADVVLRYLKEGEQTVLNDIRRHGDHPHMEELCTLAWHVIGSEDARSALAEGLANAPDEECREWCREALGRFGSK